MRLYAFIIAVSYYYNATKENLKGLIARVKGQK